VEERSIGAAARAAEEVSLSRHIGLASTNQTALKTETAASDRSAHSSRP
jgi:hypothetical protein